MPDLENCRKERDKPCLEPSRALPAADNKKRFQVGQLLGTGGMCDVFLALDLCRLAWNDQSPKVALKRLVPEFAENKQAQLALAQEFFTLRHLTHPGIVRAYELHMEPDGLCYSMELLDGLSLHQMQAGIFSGLGKNGLRMGYKLFDTLAYLHKNGVVHADVKPANLFNTSADRLVLIDFNISRVTARPGAACSPIAQGLRANLRLPANSLLHSSPERLKTGCPSVADDIFAACCTLYEMIEGSHPFKRFSSLEAEKKCMQPQKPKGLSILQWQFLKRGLSFSPNARPSAEQLRWAFERKPVISRMISGLSGK